ncbi:hypothetical protein GCM10027341_24600 [Spirosoma knui]
MRVDKLGTGDTLVEGTDTSIHFGQLPGSVAVVSITGLQMGTFCLELAQLGPQQDKTTGRYVVWNTGRQG